MKAVWSLWTPPILSGPGTRWLDFKYWLYSWILSFQCASCYYDETVLVTDDEGVRLLIDGLDLPFSSVDTQLNCLHGFNIQYWAIGKLLTYSAQDEPFLHVDNDVFLWEPLPDHLLAAPVFAQSPEPFEPWDHQWYSPQVFEAFLLSGDNGWLPEEWHWYRKHKELSQQGICCGIFGGRDLSFINYYADLAMQIVKHKGNQSGLMMLPNANKHIVLLEQYLLSAVSSYYVHNPNVAFSCAPVQYLFKDPEALARAGGFGYTHLIGPAKKSESVCARLEKRVRENAPRYYERCARLVEERKYLNLQH